MIAGCVAAVPKNIEEVNDAAFTKATGVVQRRIALPGQTVSTLAEAATDRLLDALGWEVSTLQAIIFVTQTPALQMPAMSCVLAGKLGFKGAAFDINLACSGYVYGLALAHAFGLARTLLVTGDVVSRMCKPDTAMLFGDAVACSGIDGGRLISARLGTDGTGFDKLIADPFIRMSGPDVATFALSTVPKLFADTTMNAKIDYALFHQANALLLRSIVKKVRLDPEKAPINIEKYGNCSSASIPLLIADSSATATLKEKTNRLAVFGFGAGFSWGGLMFDNPAMTVAEVVEV